MDAAWRLQAHEAPEGDEHERPDVVEYRQKAFIPKIRPYQPRIIEYEVGNCTKEVVKAPANERPIAILFHDESAFRARDAQEKSWVLDSSARKRLVGAYIDDRSDFIGPTGVGMKMCLQFLIYIRVIL
jgi:hypothetical protein